MAPVRTRWEKQPPAVDREYLKLLTRSHINRKNQQIWSTGSWTWSSDSLGTLTNPGLGGRTCQRTSGTQWHPEQQFSLSLFPNNSMGWIISTSVSFLLWVPFLSYLNVKVGVYKNCYLNQMDEFTLTLPSVGQVSRNETFLWVSGSQPGLHIGTTCGASKTYQYWGPIPADSDSIALNVMQAKRFFEAPFYPQLIWS